MTRIFALFSSTDHVVGDGVSTGGVVVGTVLSVDERNVDFLQLFSNQSAFLVSFQKVKISRLIWTVQDRCSVSKLAAPFQTCFERSAFDKTDSNLANDTSIGDCFSIGLSFTRFEFVVSKAKAFKIQASSKLKLPILCPIQKP